MPLKKYIKNWWGNIDKWILSLSLLLISIGTLLIFSSSTYIESKYSLLINKHLVFVPISLLTIFFISTISLRSLIIISIMSFFFFLLLSYFPLFLSVEMKGAKRWIKFLNFTIQPSEFLKPTYVIVSALLLSRFQKKKDNSFYINLLLLSLICVALIMQPDFGMFVLIFCTWFIQLILSGISYKFIVMMVIFGIFFTTLAYFGHDHVRFRINNFFDKDLGDNYQINNSLEAFSNGGFFGKGIGSGIFSKKLPDVHSDFIFSLAGEELGFFFSCALIFVYSLIFYRIIINALKINNLFIFLSVSGLSIMFIFQTIINMASTINLIPTKGMTLPFLSYGGSSLLSCSIMIGFILCLTRKRPKIYI